MEQFRQKMEVTIELLTEDLNKASFSYTEKGIDFSFQIPNVPTWRLDANKWLSKKDVQKLRKMYDCNSVVRDIRDGMYQCIYLLNCQSRFAVQNGKKQFMTSYWFGK